MIVMRTPTTDREATQRTMVEEEREVNRGSRESLLDNKEDKSTVTIRTRMKLLGESKLSKGKEKFRTS